MGVEGNGHRICTLDIPLVRDSRTARGQGKQGARREERQSTIRCSGLHQGKLGGGEWAGGIATTQPGINLCLQPQHPQTLNPDNTIPALPPRHRRPAVSCTWNPADIVRGSTSRAAPASLPNPTPTNPLTPTTRPLPFRPGNPPTPSPLMSTVNIKRRASRATLAFSPKPRKFHTRGFAPTPCNPTQPNDKPLPRPLPCPSGIPSTPLLPNCRLYLAIFRGRQGQHLKGNSCLQPQHPQTLNPDNTTARSLPGIHSTPSPHSCRLYLGALA